MVGSDQANNDSDETENNRETVCREGSLFALPAARLDRLRPAGRQRRGGARWLRWRRRRGSDSPATHAGRREPIDRAAYSSPERILRDFAFIAFFFLRETDW